MAKEVERAHRGYLNRKATRRLIMVRASIIRPEVGFNRIDVTFFDDLDARIGQIVDDVIRRNPSKKTLSWS